MKKKSKIVTWALVAALAAFAVPSIALAGTDDASNSTSDGSASAEIVASTEDTSSSATNWAGYMWGHMHGGMNHSGYMDADGDGVCDYYENGSGYGNGTGDTGSQGFVDEDGDGVCDYYENGSGYGNGYHHGNGTGHGACFAN